MIVTLAGHVDHGKTSLIKALTGVDTDVLAEERRRGLTIDLGFAYQRRPGGDVLGFVDVPGHHRFIHNMVAGVAAMQYALLAVDAGDGPMPQTREHLQILSLSGLSQGLVALTKCDRVPAERVAAAEAEVRSCLRGTFLEDGRILRTSAVTGAGLAELRQALWSAAGRLAANAAAGQGQFRLAVDRAFNVQGAGLVVTGTVHAGQVAKDAALHVFPSGERVRVRSLRVQDGPAQSAVAGDRAALNLAGVGLDRIGRGRWLTQMPMPERRNFIIDLQVHKDCPRPVRHWLPVHVYHATSHSTAHLALLHTSKALPGERQEAEIVTDAPLCARHGDHLVLRDQGLDLTLGGGRVLTDLSPTSLRRRHPARLAAVSAFKQRNRRDLITALLNQGPVALAPLQNTLGLTDPELAAALSEFELVRLDGAAVLKSHWVQWRHRALEFVRRHQAENPSAPGVQPNLLPPSIPVRMGPGHPERVGCRRRLGADGQRLSPALPQRRNPQGGASPVRPAAALLGPGPSAQSRRPRQAEGPAHKQAASRPRRLGAARAAGPGVRQALLPAGTPAGHRRAGGRPGRARAAVRAPLPRPHRHWPQRRHRTAGVLRWAGVHQARRRRPHGGRGTQGALRLALARKSIVSGGARGLQSRRGATTRLVGSTPTSSATC